MLDAVGAVTRDAPGGRKRQVLASLAVVWTGAVGSALMPDETWATWRSRSALNPSSATGWAVLMIFRSVCWTDSP